MLTIRPKARLLPISLLPAFALAAMIAAALLLFWRSSVPAPATPAGLPSSSAIEARYGVQFTMVGVTADGGLLDLRFSVLDADKAMAMHQNPSIQPYIIDEQTGTTIDSSPTMSHKHPLEVGRTYFELYRNPKGLVQPGRLVTVVVGDDRIEHLVAQ